LILLNGFQDPNIKFKIDTVTIALLILAFLPFLQHIVGTIKVGGTELQLRDYIREVSEEEKILIFLDAISSQKVWTFYKPRKGEEDLGHALEAFIKKLVDEKSEKLNDKIKKWFKSENINHKWFAAEIVGRFNIEKLKDICKSYYTGLNFNEILKNWQLNCLWAYSRCEKNTYETLISKLKEKINEENRIWMIDACHQMISKEENENLRGKLQNAIDEFSK
jgi:hypothetical protein